MDIRTEGVQAVLGGSAILKGVDIQVGQRELVGIIGPNGSGKSTLLKCIYRVLKPTGGAVLLDGRDLDQYSYRESARRIAVVAQHNYYNFEFSVQDVVMMGRAPHKRALDRDNADDFRLVAEALELVGMSGFARRSFSTLSGGEQQRVILARAYQPSGYQVPAGTDGHCQIPGPDRDLGHPRPEYCRHVLRPSLCGQRRGNRGLRQAPGGSHRGLYPACIRGGGQGFFR